MIKNTLQVLFFISVSIIVVDCRLRPLFLSNHSICKILKYIYRTGSFLIKRAVIYRFSPFPSDSSRLIRPFSSPGQHMLNVPSRFTAAYFRENTILTGS